MLKLFAVMIFNITCIAMFVIMALCVGKGMYMLGFCSFMCGIMCSMYMNELIMEINKENDGKDK